MNWFFCQTFVKHLVVFMTFSNICQTLWWSFFFHNLLIFNLFYFFIFVFYLCRAKTPVMDGIIISLGSNSNERQIQIKEKKQYKKQNCQTI